MSKYLAAKLGVGGEVSNARGHGSVAGGQPPVAIQAFGEEHACAVRGAQGEDVDVHLGGAGKGEAVHVGGHHVDAVAGDCNGPGVGIDQALVIKLQDRQQVSTVLY